MTVPPINRTLSWVNMVFGKSSGRFPLLIAIPTAIHLTYFPTPSLPAPLPIQQLLVMWLFFPRQLCLWSWFVSSASTWDPDLCSFNLRRRLHLHPLVVGVYGPRWHDRPFYNRRFARSFRPSVRFIFEAPSPFRPGEDIHQHHRSSYHFLLMSHDFVVIKTSFEVFFVTCLLSYI